MSDDVKTYPGKERDMTWDARLCIHVGECGRANNTLFVAGRDPWCVPDGVDPETAQDVALRCPSGALTLLTKDGSVVEAAPEENVIAVSHQGPLYVRGQLHIDGAAEDMTGVRFRAALCRCGESKRKPFCDNSHEAADFDDRGAIGERGEESVPSGGPLEIKGAKNGPLLVSGNLALVSGGGQVRWRGTKAALCRCGHSKNKPFCDGAHKEAGFEAE